MIPEEIITSLKTHLSIYSDKPLAGGDINQVYRIDTSAGTFCLKVNYSDRFPGMFEKEAQGLSLLERAGEIRVPSVVEVITGKQYSALLLEYIAEARPVTDYMFRFGASLARLHDHSEVFYGLDVDNYMGSLPQSNRKSNSWIDFFREERLEKQVRLARDSGRLNDDINNMFSRLFSRLDKLLVVEKSSLLHGDLWGGNFMISETGDACLIDPAVYYGNREVDLAMTTLFGGFSPEFYTGYESQTKLDSGWRDRLELYNLYPLLVHVNLFGTGYLGSVRKILQKFS
ncbi:MAG: fructosamine kinase family protein [Bacteroidales bacterium]|nr:fructosamine kinase family protein [Bacteroidales bacterium]